MEEALGLVELTRKWGEAKASALRAPPHAVVVVRRPAADRCRLPVARGYFSFAALALSTSTMTSCMRHGVTAVSA